MIMVREFVLFLLKKKVKYFIKYNLNLILVLLNISLKERAVKIMIFIDE